MRSSVPPTESTAEGAGWRAACGVHNGKACYNKHLDVWRRSCMEGGRDEFCNFTMQHWAYQLCLMELLASLKKKSWKQSHINIKTKTQATTTTNITNFSPIDNTNTVRAICAVHFLRHVFQRGWWKGRPSEDSGDAAFECPSPRLHYKGPGLGRGCRETSPFLFMSDSLLTCPWSKRGRPPHPHCLRSAHTKQLVHFIFVSEKIRNTCVCLVCFQK